MIRRLGHPLLQLYRKHIRTRILLRRNVQSPDRKLDIGPGENPADGFECLNIVPSRCTDYVLDATSTLPFQDHTFAVVHASHVLEHIPWFETQRVLAEWVRILKPGGSLEIWVPDGYKLSTVLINLSNGAEEKAWDDGWLMKNPEKNPFLWVNGRIFYGARDDYPSWHKAIFTEASLRKALSDVGLIEIRRLHSDEVRGNDHGWINLGVAGKKP